MNGMIELVIGPMFAGKSTFMVQKCNEAIHDKKRVVIIKHASDKRYEKNIVTHDQGSFDNVIYLSNISDIHMDDYDVIGIDEGHFFSSLDLFCLDALKNDKHVIISGLSSDYLMRPFDIISKVIPLSTHIYKMNAKCTLCDQCANFTKRITKTNELFVIGGINEYEPRCYTCYHQQEETNV